MTPLENILAKLETKGCPPKARAGQWQSKCPAHEDRTPSLSITEVGEGQVLIHCHAGCTTKAVCTALDIQEKDLFQPDPLKESYRKTKEYIYRDADGEIVYRVVKMLDLEGNKSFRQHAYLGDGQYDRVLGKTTKVLYYLPRVLAAIEKGRPIWIVEGEKDVENLSFATGAVATCNPGGADNGTGGKFTDQMIGSLDGAKRISIIIDNDPTGTIHGQTLTRRLTRPDRQICVWRTTYGKDISDHLQKGHQLSELELIYDSHDPSDWLDAAHHENLPPTLADPNDNGWQLKTLGEHIKDGWEEVKPTILERTDGHALFYPGKINSVYGESNSGKTWILMVAMAQELALGHHVAYIDFEDRPTTFAERLYILGCTPHQVNELAHYSHPQNDRTPQEIENLLEYLVEKEVTLLGIDSAGEGLALSSKNPNADEEVAAWYREIPRRLADSGACVILVDHSPKNDLSQGHAIGSQRKKAAIDGSSYKVTQDVVFSKEHTNITGKISLKCAKDRHGTYPIKTIVATILVSSLPETVTPNNEYHSMTMTVVNPKTDTSATYTPVRTQIVEWLSTMPDQTATSNDFRNKATIFGCPRQAIEYARDQLVIEGTIVLDKSRQTHKYRLESTAPDTTPENALARFTARLTPTAPTTAPDRAAPRPPQIIPARLESNGNQLTQPRRNATLPIVADGAVGEIPAPKNDDDPYSDYNLFEMDNPTDPRSFTQ